MANVIFSKLSQMYGYESSGEQVKIELVVTRSGGSPITITTYLVEGDDYTPKQIWDGVKAAWNAHSWVIPAPSLTIDHTNYLTTTFISDFEITFKSIKLYYDIRNPRSLELPVILGFSTKMASATGSITLNSSTDFIDAMPYMGSWRMQTTIDTEYGFNSSISTWVPIKARTESSTDITRTSVDNGPELITRGYKLTVAMVPYKYLKYYDLFLDFARRGEVEISFGFDLFMDQSVAAYIWGSESGEDTLVFDAEQLVNYDIALIPKSSLEV